MATQFTVHIDKTKDSFVIHTNLREGPKLVALLASGHADGQERYTFEELIAAVAQEPDDVQIKMLQTFANSVNAIRARRVHQPAKPPASAPRPEVPGAPPGVHRSAQAPQEQGGDLIEPEWPRKQAPAVEPDEDTYADEERAAIQAESAEAEAAAAMADAQPMPKLEPTPQDRHQEDTTGAQNVQASPSRAAGSDQPAPDGGTRNARQDEGQAPQTAPDGPQGAPASDAPRQPGQRAAVQAAAQAARDAHPPPSAGPNGQGTLQYGREPGQHVRSAEHAGQTVADPAPPPRGEVVYEAGARGAAQASSGLDEFLDAPASTGAAQPTTSEPAAPPMNTEQPSAGDIPDNVIHAASLRDVFKWLFDQGHQTPQALAEAAFAYKGQIPLVARARNLEDRARTWLERMNVLDQAEADATQ